MAGGRCRLCSDLPGIAMPAPVPPRVAGVGGGGMLPHPWAPRAEGEPGPVEAGREGRRGSSQLSPNPEHSDLPGFPCLLSGFS